MPTTEMTLGVPSEPVHSYRPKSCGGPENSVWLTQAWFDAWTYRKRTWLNQPKPYTKTLPYSDLKTIWEGSDVDMWWDRKCLNGTWYRTTFRGGAGTWGDSTFGKSQCEAHSMPSAASAQLAVLEALQEAKWNFPVFAAEVTKTANLVTETARKLARGLTLLKQRKWRKLLKHFKLREPAGPRDAWLSYRYGWIPLISDVGAAAEAAASTLVDRPPTLFIKKRGRRSESVTRSIGEGSVLGVRSGFPSRLIAEKEFTVCTDSAAWLLVEARAPALMTLEQFGLANPALVAWELLPFSFVADWFVGIGDYLAAQTATLGVTVLDGGVSQLSVRTYWSRVVGIAPVNGVVGGITPRGWVQSRKYQRSTWSGSPPPLQLGSGLNMKRFADSAALLHAVFSKANTSSLRYR